MTQTMTKAVGEEAPVAVEPSRDQWPPVDWPRDAWPLPELLPEEYWNAALWETT